MHRTALMIASLWIAACAPLNAPSPAAPELAFLGGYRSAEDPCQRVGETAFTNPFLDHTTDLVGCPQGYENMDLFRLETGGTLVAATATHQLFSIPRR